MWTRSHYVEITAHRSVRSFLDNSQAYRDMIHIPYAKLSKSNQALFDELCDPVSFAELELVFRRVAKSAMGERSMFGLFVGSYVDYNENFQYCLALLKEQYESNVQASETTSLLAI